MIVSLQVGWLKSEDQTILTLHDKVVTHNVRISVRHDNQSTWQLHIRHVKESDRGCYMCQINTSIMKKQYGCIDVHGKNVNSHSTVPTIIFILKYAKIVPSTLTNSMILGPNFCTKFSVI